MKQFGKIGGTAVLMLAAVFAIRHKKKIKRKIKKIIIGVKQTKKDYKNKIQEEKKVITKKIQKVL